MKPHTIYHLPHTTNRQGFTLTELLIVVSILIILILLVIGMFLRQVLKANDGKRKTDLHKIRIAIEEYEKDHDCYPLPALVVCNPGNGLVPYLSKIPCDPVTKVSYYYEYEDSSCPKWFRVYSRLQNEKDIDAINYIGPGSAYNYYVESPNAPNIVVVTPGPTATPVVPMTDYYGCINSRCVKINWDATRPGPECDPNYQNSSCYSQCGRVETECKDWRL
jgi:type II secretory pathway pseudopilin PulG